MGEAIDPTQFEPPSIERWREQVRRDLGGRDPGSLRWRSPDGLELEPLYTAADVPVLDRGAPGSPPFVRGSEGRREWSIVHELAGIDREAQLESARRALAEGADAVWLGPEASDRLERAGDLEPLRALGAPVWIDAGARSLAIAAAELREPASGLRVLCDPLGALARGGLPCAPDRALARLAELVGRARTDRPSARPVLASARPYAEAGASATDELALLVASGLAYLRGLSEAGLPLADLPRRMLFEVALDADFFASIAKLRAARLLWSKVLRTLGIDGPEQGMRIRAVSARRGASTIDPHTNLLRGTASAFAAVVGGAELVTVLPYDELAGPPSAHAERLARTTQLVLREEAQLGRVLDPAGGSYFLEALTDRLARGAWSALQAIEHLGGVVRGLIDGSIAERVARDAEDRRRALAARERGIVAVSRYPSPEDPPPRSERREPAAEGAKSEKGAGAEGATLASMIEAAAAASFDELTAALGEPVRVSAIVPRRDAEPFESLRLRAAALPERARVAIVIGVGDARALAPRMDFAAEALEVAGLRVRRLGAHASAADALAALSGPLSVVAPCADDAGYADVMAELGPALAGRARAVVLATRENEALREHATAFVHRGADLVAALDAILRALEEAPR